MNKDIKEIIDNLKEDVEQNILIEVRGNVFKPLLDYITNSQEEMEKLRSDYIGEKLKNDKAIEYIKRNCLEFNDKYACQGLNNDKVDVLLDILRGEE